MKRNTLTSSLTLLVALGTSSAQAQDAKPVIGPKLLGNKNIAGLRAPVQPSPAAAAPKALPDEAKAAPDKAADKPADGKTKPPTPSTEPTPGKPKADTSGLPQFPEDVEFQPRGPGERIGFSLEEASLADLVKVISQMTGQRFIFGGKVRDIKATIYSPQKVTVAEAYQAFLAILETNGLTVVPHGRFLKIVEVPGIAAQATPIYATGQAVPNEERYVTRLYRLSNISAQEASGLLNKFKSKDGDISVYAPSNLLIITDTGSNIRRLLRIVEEIDVGGAASQIWVQPVYHATAQELAQKLTEIFDVSGAKAPAAPPPDGGNVVGGEESDARISKILAEERTNSLVIVATEPAYLRILELIKHLDVQQSGDGDIHVLPLQHAMAKDLAQTLSSILTGAAPAGGQKGGANAPTTVFEGDVKVTADEATNSLLITSSVHDYASIRAVISKLDQPRRQVFIEAVILDVQVDHSNQFNVNYHGGYVDDFTKKGDTIMFGGFNPMTSVAPTADSLQGFALGVRGPEIKGTENLFPGVSVPAFGVILNALASSSDSNLLATPHIIATDNVDAEINVGQNIPLQTNLLGGMGGLPLAAMGGSTGSTSTNPLAALSSFGGYGAAPRQDVGIKIKIKPHINDSNQVRLELQEEISEAGASAGTAQAVSIVKRTAQTTIVVRDQQTVVIGGLMRDNVVNSQTKVPVLGDLPLLGFLFRSSKSVKQKSNLILILTPSIVRDQDDLREVFERKMRERQEFLDRYFVFSDHKPYNPPKDFSRTNGLIETIRQAMLEVDDSKRLLEESRPDKQQRHTPQVPIEWVPSAQGATGPTTAGAPSPPAGDSAPAKTPPVKIKTPARNITK